jgi:AcrR family transcriptional regulator
MSDDKGGMVMPKITATTMAEHRERTYEAILDAAEALIAEHGVDRVSMGDIAKHAGVARTAIYNYAPDKLALLTASVERAARSLNIVVAGIAANTQRSPSERLSAILRSLLLSFAPRAQNLSLLRAAHRMLPPQQRAEAVGALHDEVQTQVTRVIQDGIEAGEYAPPGDLSLAVALVAGVTDVAIARALDEPSSSESIATAAVTFIQRALGFQVA